MKYEGSVLGSYLAEEMTQGDITELTPAVQKKLPLCAGCGLPIQDQFVLKVQPDLVWHTSCLRCVECSEPLDEQCTCYMKNGKTYCKNDYLRLFRTKCYKCGIYFTKTDYVMRACEAVFHIDCFRCTECGKQLMPGNKFSLRSFGLLCKEDNDLYSARSPSDSTKEEEEGIMAQSPDCDHPSPAEETKVSFSKVNHGSSKRSQKEGLSGKTTRIRTVLNENQLQTLRSCYAANPRPDALMKEQLVEMTKLSPRVIRVWFQNKRCKDKKKTIQLKQMHHNEKMMNGGLQGVPMVAPSPMRHEGGPMTHPSQMDIQPFSRQWKPAMEFSLHQHQEISEHNSYQNLMHNVYTTPDDYDDYCIDGFVPDSVSVSSHFSGTSESPQSTA